MIRVAIFEDSVEYAESLKRNFSLAKDIIVVGVFNNVRSIYEKLNRLMPDIVLMDISLSDSGIGKEGVAGLKEVKALFPNVKVIMLTNQLSNTELENDKIYSSLFEHAENYLNKSIDFSDLLDCIRTLVNSSETEFSPKLISKLHGFIKNGPPQNPDKHGLTDRQIKILELLQKYNANEIAKILLTSENNVREHLKKIYMTLDVKSDKHAISKAKNLRLFSSNKTEE